ncbi:hypothetical protein DL766_009391 [Monosporascus sp. MC13-8B]|uniref:Large-conductance mechanosensitive channel n=1 Tax=Monosporascus cannonballus TaxID=155416 RepID=A0ABY0GVB0_9PEZI|nr:hypothetical protein DL763_011194 [Monosporascus cannonballus]RYO78139.1 hypothetical protein DL762_008851 [Monosporascus cannonballus]RYP15507.1 hypothetical protein DL766_009391 [Monosporascus sp. MC13-8B]
MPNNGRGFDFAAEERRALLEQGQERAKKFLTGFLEFAFSENILQFAFGLIIAEGFTRVTNSLVNDIILPPLSTLFPLNRNLDEKFAVLKPGPNYDSAMGYTTLRQAIEDGAVVMAYGVFINRVINFVGIGVALYALAKVYQLFSKAPIIKATVKCRYCRKNINKKAVRCVNCTSWQDGREERMG